MNGVILRRKIETGPRYEPLKITRLIKRLFKAS